MAAESLSNPPVSLCFFFIDSAFYHYLLNEQSDYERALFVVVGFLFNFFVPIFLFFFKNIKCVRIFEFRNYPDAYLSKTTNPGRSLCEISEICTMYFLSFFGG